MNKPLILFVSLLAIALIATAFIDDDLSPEAQGLLAKVEAPRESEAYLYFSGIIASEKDDPLIVGRRLLEEYRKFELDDSYEIAEYPEAKKIHAPEGELYCKAWEATCLQRLFTQNFDIDSLQRDYSVLLRRSEVFHEFQEYQTLTKPTIDEEYPPYQFLASAERIKTLAAIYEHRSGKSALAVLMLSEQLDRLRKAMELQDNLIGKMVFLIGVSEVLDVTSIVLSQSGDGIATKQVPSLSSEEKSFEALTVREFGLSYYLFRNLDMHPEFFQEGGSVPGWVIRPFYKPNMTINAIVPTYMRLNRLARLGPQEFAQEVQRAGKNEARTSKIRNYTGSVLIAIGPNLEQYVARMMDLEVKIALFNHIYYLRKNAEDATNPFGIDQPPEATENEICFDGPMENSRKLRCLRLSI